jgi:hypothetical protein
MGGLVTSRQTFVSGRRSNKPGNPVTWAAFQAKPDALTQLGPRSLLGKHGRPSLVRYAEFINRALNLHRDLKVKFMALARSGRGMGGSLVRVLNDGAVALAPRAQPIGDGSAKMRLQGNLTPDGALAAAEGTGHFIVVHVAPWW